MLAKRKKFASFTPSLPSQPTKPSSHRQHSLVTMSDDQQLPMPADECRKDQACLDAYASVHYLPSIFGNALFLGIFGLVLITQVYFGIRKKTWGYMVAMIGGVVLEIVGYYGRIAMNTDPFDGKPDECSLCDDELMSSRQQLHHLPSRAHHRPCFLLGRHLSEHFPNHYHLRQLLVLVQAPNGDSVLYRFRPCVSAPAVCWWCDCLNFRHQEGHRHGREHYDCRSGRASCGHHGVRWRLHSACNRYSSTSRKTGLPVCFVPQDSQVQAVPVG
jgi:hypothetical protein